MKLTFGYAPAIVYDFSIRQFAGYIKLAAWEIWSEKTDYRPAKGKLWEAWKDGEDGTPELFIFGRRITLCRVFAFKDRDS